MDGHGAASPDRDDVARPAVARANDRRPSASDAEQRDATAASRDALANRRDIRAEADAISLAASDAPAGEKLEYATASAARDRRGAAGDRGRAAHDRSEAADEIASLKAELHTAHLDDLTGAYRREMGMLALAHEIERARRAGGSFVIVFVDVDGLKQVNDGAGHAAGDSVLQALVSAMRSHLRSFDPVLRYGGDEFVAGLGGISIDEVGRRFEVIDQAVRREVGVGISIGLAQLEPDETLEGLTARADALLLDAKTRRHE